MAERGQIETLLNAVYAARARSDVAAIVELATPDIHFEIAGSAKTLVATQADGKERFGAALDELVKTFELIDYEIQNMTIDGSNVTVHWRPTFRSTVTGETAETEIVDVIRMEDARIASIVEFCDTALAARMMGK